VLDGAGRRPRYGVTVTSPDPTGASPDSGPQPGTGLLFLAVGALLLLATAPTVILLALLAGEGGGAPAALAVLSTVFVGPALSATLYALGDKARDDGLAPVAAFVKGYRLNVADVLKLWVPALAVLAVLTFTLVNQAGQAPAWAIGVGIGAVVIIVLALVQCTVIASFFVFRAADVAKLGLYFLGRLPRVSLLVLVLLAVAAAVAFFMAPVVLAILGVLWAAALLQIERPMLAEVRLRFIDG
jgi:hypothetical protein